MVSNVVKNLPKINNIGNGCLFIIYMVVSNNNNGLRTDKADEMRDIYFQHREWNKYVNCFPKTECVDDRLCYSKQRETICNTLNNDCSCRNQQNCTLHDWATVDPSVCHIDNFDEDVEIVAYYILIAVSIFLHLVGTVFVWLSLNCYVIDNITHPLYYVCIILSGIYYLYLCVQYIIDINNYEHLYFKGMFLQSLYFIMQFITYKWPYLINKLVIRFNINTNMVQYSRTQQRGTITTNVIANLPNPQTVVPIPENIIPENNNHPTVANINIIQEQPTQQLTGIVQLVAQQHQPLELIQRTNELTTNPICLICCENNREIVLMPCNHLCYCQQCGSNPSIRVQNCPYCREPVHNAIKIYVP